MSEKEDLAAEREDAEEKKRKSDKRGKWIIGTIMFSVIGFLTIAIVIRMIWPTMTQKQLEPQEILMQVFEKQRSDLDMLGHYWTYDLKASAGVSFGSIGIPDNARYKYVLHSEDSTFICKATANLDDDPAFDTWSIDETGELKHVIDDRVEEYPPGLRTGG